MNEEELCKIVLDALLEVAPDVDAANLDAAIPFRDQFDFDSMDHLSLVMALHRRLGIEIPERDYPHLACVDAAASYLRSRLPAAKTSQ